MPVAKSFTRPASFLTVLAVYALAFFAGALAYGLFKNAHPLVAMFAADIAATLFVWLAGVVFRNSSLYDPYWSVAPLVIVCVWFLQQGVATAPAVLTLVAVFVWGLRLTANWAVRWKGIAQEDWRYAMYRERAPKLWFLTNLFGINLMPTVLVYLGVIPAYYVLSSAKHLGFLTCVGFAVCIAAALLQLVADRQKQAFRSRGDAQCMPGLSPCIDEGIWRVSRHPNYCGEVAFWWGVWLMQMGAVPDKWFTIIGALSITLLFVFISIPMMEAHILASRPSYADYKRRVSMLIPLPRR